MFILVTSPTRGVPPAKRRSAQIAKQRADFELALKRARCPKDGGHILELDQPKVVCEKCSTRYILAIQSGMFLMRSKLIEQEAAPVMQTKETVIQREIVKVPCKHCGTLNDLAITRFCPSCGAPVH